MKEKISPTIWILALSAFLTPILGGQIHTNKIPLDTGLPSALLSGGAVPILQHALLALPVFIALAVQLLSLRVMQVPSKTIGFIFAGVIGFVIATVPIASYKGVSIPLAFEWIAYGCALYATVSAVGRRSGPVVIFSAVFLGCTFVALKGVMEYGEMKSIDPTWRIFAGWINPNATAAMLLVGLFLGIGLCITQEGVAKLICGLFSAVMLLAVVLTKSRGALLVFALCLLLFVLMVAVWSDTGRSKRYGKLVTGVLFFVVGITTILIPIAQPLMPIGKAAAVQISQEATGLGRLSGSGLATDQSTLFRRLLWHGTGQILRDYPSGVGIGAYRFVSAKSGLTTQTELAHEGYLQLAVEATVFAPALLAVGLLFWVSHVGKAPEALPKKQNILRAAAVAAVFSVLAHNVVDSDFYYFGIGLTTFLLLGTSLLLSADAVAPEFVPAGARRGAAALAGLFAVGLLFFGYIEMIESRMRYELSQRDVSGAQADSATLQSLGGFDGEAIGLASRTAGSLSEMKELSQRAVENGPTTQTLRDLASVEEKQGDVGTAISTLNRALALDPNNLTTLARLLAVEQQANDGEAQLTAQRMIAVEDSLYFRVRSLPEMVPTETYLARTYLAAQTQSPRKKLELLTPAMVGYHEYLLHTYKQVTEMAKSGGDYGGESVEVAQQKLQLGLSVAREVQRLAADTGDRATTASAAGFAADFAKALEPSVTK